MSHVKIIPIDNAEEFIINSILNQGYVVINYPTFKDFVNKNSKGSLIDKVINVFLVSGIKLEKHLTVAYDTYNRITILITKECHKALNDAGVCMNYYDNHFINWLDQQTIYQLNEVYEYE